MSYEFQTRIQTQVFKFSYDNTHLDHLDLLIVISANKNSASNKFSLI